MKFNFKKISAIGTSMLLTCMTMGIAAAANYPAPFVSGGTSNVAIVYGTGEGVSSLDAIHAGNIQTDLQARLGGTSGSTSGSTATGGDSFIIEGSSDNLNLGNTFGVFAGTADSDDLSTLLADGTYVAGDNDEFKYEQSIKLGTPTLSHFRDSDYENLKSLDSQTPVLGFKIDSGTFMMNYTLDFISDAESDIATDEVEDIEGSDIQLMGKTYYVSDLKNGTNTGYFGKMSLLDSASLSTVNEGETVNVQGKDVSITYIDNNEVVFDVDGQRVPSSGKLQVGQSARIAGGAYLGVRDISKLEIAGSTGSASFSIGTGKLEITSSSGEITMNDETVKGVKGYVYKGTPSAGVEKIDKIVIKWTTDGEQFLTAENELTMPGFEAVKFTMADFVRTEEEKVTIEKDDDTNIQITVPGAGGDVTFNILYANSSGEFIGIGKSATEKLVTTTSNELIYTRKTAGGADQDIYFVATYNTTTDAQSHLLRASMTESSSRNTTDIDYMLDGSWTIACDDRKAQDSCKIPNSDIVLTINTIEYISGGLERLNVTGGTNVNFNTFFTEGGLKIYLPYIAANSSSSDGAINVTGVANGPGTTGHNWDSWYLKMDGENKDDTLEGGTAFSFTIDDTSTGNLQIVSVNSTGGGVGTGSGGENGKLVGQSTGVYEAYVIDDVAPRIIHYTKPDEDYAEVYYPTGDSESYAEVYLAETGVTISTDGTTTPGGSLGDVLVKDSEVSSVSTKNLIIVGGSCINSAAATALGVATRTCGAAFTTATGVGSGEFLIKSVNGAFSSGKIALVVAGYDAADTVNAATFLRTQTVDTSKEYKGTSSTSATMVTTEA